MTDSRAAERKTTLDKDLARLGELGEATSFVSRRLVAPGLALLFMALAAFATSMVTGGEMRTLAIIAAAALAAYMALNIGANDVANNVGPAVGAKVLTMGGALAMAAVFEVAGALVAGGEVVETISSRIVPPASVDGPTLALLMLAALLSAALWINVATWIGAPVSTTHSIVGAVVGAGVAAAGFASVDWSAIAAITASWITSPILGGVIAAAFLAFIKTAIIYREDKITAARLWVPLLIAVMAGAFAIYLTLIGNVANLSGGTTALIGLGAFVLAWVAAHFYVRRLSEGMENRRQSLKRLFTVPLIISAALLSFAHGANDVANAVGPLAAIVRAVGDDGGAAGTTPIWVMTIGALGISFGLLLFGPRLVRMVGQEITKLNPMRAFCIALSAALTVIVASWFGLPVSSTHIAVGAVFGVGFFREWYLANSVQRRRYLQRRAAERAAGLPDLSGAQPEETPGKAKTGKRAAQTEITRRRLVRRAHVRTIVAAWVVTVPVSASLAAAIFACLATLA
ncbi:inorganic phosphate transporter [Kumtagia ephedrae]|uniref:Phosphate transporter n=1 Tax=Kumtagia ephedrae TaxID=2116701 RepID=A0A2P7RMG8_9HYPH|nr:inorganic phosphate transporter [Mesorhizobium ephedrae]PSJ51414.1 anion permease [Mesorhizobium ephedrae]